MPYGKISYIPKGQGNSKGQLVGSDGMQYHFRPEDVANAPFDQELLGKRVSFSTGHSGFATDCVRVTVVDEQ